jgi:flagellar protein FlgJ
LAISPPSDIVLDVARAAEPSRLEAARAQLASRTTAAGAASSIEFSLGDLRNSPLASAATQTAQGGKGAPAPYVKFEAMVLQSFLQSMMPKQAEAVYGEGMSGDMWKSLLSQELGTTMADRGGIGIADSLLKGHYLEGDTKVAISGISEGPEKAQLDRERGLSTALVQEMQRRLTSDTAGKTTPADGI